MQNVRLIALVAALPLILAACTYGSSNSNTNTAVIDLTTNASVNSNANVNATANANSAAATNQNTNTAVTQNITVTSSGFSPSSVTVAAGTVVTWTNNSGSTVRIVSDPHPTHTDLPGLDSGSLADGAVYSFTFTQVGSWGYHNHLNPTTKGTIVVQ